jgi:FkbM family methyltransferase
MRQIIKSAFRSGLAVLLSSRAGTKLYERLFEASPYRVADLMVGLQTQPKFDLTWTTRLLNGKKVRIPVQADNPRSWEFAHAYHWHDVEIRDLEWAILRKFAADHIDPIFIDIGANMGLRSLLPLSLGLHCILFEPNHALREFTVKLFAGNDFRGYELYNICLADRTGTAKFYVSANSYMSSLDRQWLTDADVSREIELPVTTLDDWMSKRPDLSQKPSFIKIDVEGAELQVLKGARRYVERLRPPIICEIANKPDNRGPIWDYCYSLQYGIHSLGNLRRWHAEPLGRSIFIDRAEESNFLLAAKESGF